MKTTIHLSAGLAFLTLVTNLEASFVTLTLGGPKTIDVLSIGTNEVAQIRWYFDPTLDFYLMVAKGTDKYQLGQGQMSRDFIIAGPATLTLTSWNNRPRAEFQSAFMTIEITPESFPPGLTITRPLPSGEGIEQPAIGLFAEQVALPHPHPCPFSHWEKGGRQAGLRVRSLVVLVSRLRAALERLNPAPSLILFFT